MATFHKANEYFQKKYAESLRVLEKYKLKATIKHTNHEVLICLTYLGENQSIHFDLQHSRCIATAKFTMSAIDNLAGEFFAALPRLIPMLELRNTYIRMNGWEISSDSLNSLHNAFGEIDSTDTEFDADVDGHWMLWDNQNDVFHPISSTALKALESMYAGATFCHSAKSMLSAYMTQPSTKVEALTPGSHRYALDGSIWFLSMECDTNGLTLIPAYQGQKPLGTYQTCTQCQFDGHVSFFWPGIEEGFLTLSWDAVEAAFNIDRALYAAHASCSDDPLVVLKACMALLQLDSGKDLESLAADFKLGKVAVVRQPEQSNFGKVSKYNAEFQEQFEDALEELAQYGLKARLRQKENEHLIWLTYGGKPFSLQYVEQIEADDMSEETLEEVGSKFCDALEDLYPMLQARKRYMDLRGKDLDDDTVASLHEAWDDTDEEDEEDDRVPVGESWYLATVGESFSRNHLNYMIQMYVAGATLHSKYSALESFLVMPSEAYEGTPDNRTHHLKACPISMKLQSGPCGLVLTVGAGYASTTNFEVANLTADSDLEISLPPTFWKAVNVSWAQLEKRFGISKELFDVHMEMGTGLMEALKSAYQHVNTKPMTDAMVVAAGFDFNDASEPVGDAFPAESNATVFAIMA